MIFVIRLVCCSVYNSKIFVVAGKINDLHSGILHGQAKEEADAYVLIWNKRYSVMKSKAGVAFVDCSPRLLCEGILIN